MFWPGGHGALLKNLNDIDGDILFIKNIDNIVPDRLKDITVLYKKILGGYLVRLQEEIFYHLKLLSEKRVDDSCCHGLFIFAKESCFFFFLIHSGMIRYPIGRRLSSGCSIDLYGSAEW